MATEAESIRNQIAATRAELARDVDRLAEQTSPGRLARRLKGGLRSLKERAIGTSKSTASTVSSAASDPIERLHEVSDATVEAIHGASETLQSAPRTVARATQGSPIGVGLIAFGGGLLAAALIPETAAERQAVQELSEHAAPVVAPLEQASRDFVADIRDTVETAAEQIRVAAVDAAGHVQSAAGQGVADVRATASDGAHEVRTAALGGADEVRRQD
jgi:hypothetical protein